MSLWSWFRLLFFFKVLATVSARAIALPTQILVVGRTLWIRVWLWMGRSLAAVSGCWGSRQDAYLSNGASAFRVRDREVFLSSNEMRPGKKKRRPDVQWIQGTRGSWWG